MRRPFRLQVHCTEVALDDHVAIMLGFGEVQYVSKCLQRHAWAQRLEGPSDLHVLSTDHPASKVKLDAGVLEVAALAVASPPESSASICAKMYRCICAMIAWSDNSGVPMPENAELVEMHRDVITFTNPLVDKTPEVTSLLQSWSNQPKASTMDRTTKGGVCGAVMGNFRCHMLHVRAVVPPSEHT